MSRTPFSRNVVAGAIALGVSIASSAVTHAEDNVIVRVNDIAITEKDMKLAATEIGPQLSSVPEEQRQQVLIEYLIENTLFAMAGKAAKVSTGDGFDDRLSYYRQRAMRDAYFEKAVMSTVTEADAKATYDQQIGSQTPKEEVRARHILVKTEADARDVVERIGRGGDFAELAKELSQGPSKSRGGDLGFFSKGQMVKPFEEAVFKLEKGGVSAPVKTQFGWHVIKLEEKRTQELPKFGPLKDRIMASLIQQKAQQVLGKLRENAKIEFTDKELEQKLKEARRGSFSGTQQ
ncbi:MAG: peptidylprolyl isomerase [Hyphomicrobiaceae bacterium]